MYVKCNPLLWKIGAVVLATGLSSVASADIFRLTYTGAFDSRDSLTASNTVSGTFADPTPFTATALFDTTSPNIAAPVGVAGFVAYSPIAASLTVDGNTYAIQTYNQNPTTGVTVAIFDNTTPFGVPGHYAVGLLQNPLADGAGFIGDWLTASPNFSAARMVSTEFTGYVGVGYGSGPVLTRDPMGNPTSNAIVPIPLTNSAGNIYSLTLGNYNAEVGASPLNTAVIQAVVPEPGAVAFVVPVLLGGAVFLRKRSRTK